MIETFRVPVILMYHSVRYAAGGSIYRIAIAPDRFERHIEFLTSRYRIVPLSDFAEALESRAKSDGIACITFDDGFADNLTVARDILTKYRSSATVFIPTGFVGRSYFWWDALYAVCSAASGRPDAARRELQAQFPELRLGSDIARADWFTTVWDYLRRRPLDEAYGTVEDLVARFGTQVDNLPRPVTPKELEKCSGWPFEIGSHAVSDRPLPSLSIEEARTEIHASRAYLEAHIRRPVRTFSYPFGLSDREVAASCRAAGYSCAVSLMAENYSVSYFDAFDLPRIDGADGDVDELVAKLGKFEQENSRRFVICRTIGPSPLEISPERRSTYSAANVGTPPPPHFRSADFFRPTPISRIWGCDRGTPLDRPFIEQFIQTHAGDLYGRILEIQEAKYAGKYARPGSQIDILDIDSTNGSADIIDDLQSCSKIEDETYDCLVLTQVLQLIPDFKGAIATAARILRPGGVLLLTSPGITPAISTNEEDFSWSFFKPGLKRILSAHFDTRKLLLHPHGNVGLAASSLMGLSTEDVPPDLFAFQDAEYPIVLTARAVKPLPVPAELVWTPVAESPDISVVIPMFNAERTIKETLFSVSQQSHDSFEILVVDDGSTDGSRRIVEDIARKSHGRITVLEHAGNTNRGLSLSRNLAIEHARGEFLVFLDADDTIHREKFAHDLRILRSHPEAAAVVGRALWWWDGSGERDAHLEIIFQPKNRIVHPPEFFNATFQTETGGCPCIHSWMVRRSAIDKIEPFDPYVMTYEDQKFLAELSLRFSIYVASACLCDYRRKEATLGATAVASGTDPIARSRFLDWKAEVVKSSPTYPQA